MKSHLFFVYLRSLFIKNIYPLGKKMRKKSLSNTSYTYNRLEMVFRNVKSRDSF